MSILILLTTQSGLATIDFVLCQTNTRLSLADEAVRLGGNLDPLRRSLLLAAIQNSAVALKRLRRRVNKALEMRRRRALNPELYRWRVRQSNARHKDRRLIYNRNYHRAHKEQRKLDQLRSIRRDPERYRKRRSAYGKHYRAVKGDQVREYHRKYNPGWRAKEMRENPEFVLKDRMRSALLRGLKSHNLKKTQRTESMVGCSIAHLKAHIESQFLPGMSWADNASYSIDHIVPLKAFNLLDPEERFWSFNWRNLRPMDLWLNKSKHATISFPLPSWLPAHLADRIHKRSVDRLALKA